MFILGFAPSANDRFRGWEYEHDCAAATLVDLSYRYFLGDISISTEEVTMKTRFEWVPVYDFGLSMQYISAQLADSDGLHSYEFKESDDWVSVRRRGVDIYISTSFERGIAWTPYVNFRDEVSRFLTATTRDLSSSFPALTRNTELAGVLELG